MSNVQLALFLNLEDNYTDNVSEEALKFLSFDQTFLASQPKKIDSSSVETGAWIPPRKISYTYLRDFSPLYRLFIPFFKVLEEIFLLENDKTNWADRSPRSDTFKFPNSTYSSRELGAHLNFMKCSSNEETLVTDVAFSIRPVIAEKNDKPLISVFLHYEYDQSNKFHTQLDLKKSYIGITLNERSGSKTLIKSVAFYEKKFNKVEDAAGASNFFLSQILDYFQSRRSESLKTAISSFNYTFSNKYNFFLLGYDRDSAIGQEFLRAIRESVLQKPTTYYGHHILIQPVYSCSSWKTYIDIILSDPLIPRAAFTPTFYRWTKNYLTYYFDKSFEASNKLAEDLTGLRDTSQYWNSFTQFLNLTTFYRMTQQIAVKRIKTIAHIYAHYQDENVLKLYDIEKFCNFANSNNSVNLYENLNVYTNLMENDWFSSFEKTKQWRIIFEALEEPFNYNFETKNWVNDIHLSDVVSMLRQIHNYDDTLFDRIKYRDVKSARDLHDELSKLNATILYPNELISERFYSWITDFGLDIPDTSLRIVIPKTTTEVRGWGQRQRHCLGSYAESAKKGNCLVIGVHDSEHDIWAAHLQLAPFNKNHSCIIKQMRAARNIIVPEPYSTVIKNHLFNAYNKHKEELIPKKKEELHV